VGAREKNYRRQAIGERELFSITAGEAKKNWHPIREKGGTLGKSGGKGERGRQTGEAPRGRDNGSRRGKFGTLIEMEIVEAGRWCR